jgi:MerR family transcriptional regulator, light-induced transcriptional regulator
MRPKSSRRPPAVQECAPEPVVWPGGAGPAGVAGVDGDISAVRLRVSRLTRTLETDVIPRLVRQHREIAAPAGPMPNAAEVQEFVAALVREDDEHTEQVVQLLRQRGVSVSSLYIDLLTPAAREIGSLWEQDRVDFATATVSLGRLQRLMRHLSPDFGREVEHPSNGRRVLLTQPDSEQHMFGLSMVAEFFRRDGWDVLGGVAGVGVEAVAWVRRDWFDVAGFSIGSELSLPWLRDTIAAVRSASRNTALVVLVGGPLFSIHPEWAGEVGADATTDGRNAPSLAESIVASRVQEQSGRARMT